MVNRTRVENCACSRVLHVGIARNVIGTCVCGRNKNKSYACSRVLHVSIAGNVMRTHDEENELQ